MKEIAGIQIPDSALCAAATEYARGVSAPFLFNHVMRTYAFGALVARRVGQSYDAELLYLGALLHDLGLTDEVPVQARFEVEGADAAVAFLTSKGMEEERAAVVWDAIALHTTLEIPQRKRPEIALVQTGAGVDVGVIPLSVLPESTLAQVLEALPRLGLKRALLEALAALFERSPKAAASPVVADVAARVLDGSPRFNFCDALDAAAFAD